ncbi:fatty acid desaturase [Catovirus CTV1]|uniref:Fatty acid desaturase n=1 Tax=Catovirus CTV1 TaxID=1977631 RepID=A0A1V0S9E0_9VIRU|nr:fatty acid desaturase [Catovirus CTV1]
MEKNNKTLLYKHISKYSYANWILSLFHTMSTLCLFYICIKYLNIITVPLLSLILVRTFIIFHDLAHNNFFPNKKINFLLGNIFGILILTPLSNWTEEHSLHHKHANNINKKQYTQTAVWTLEQYNKSNFLDKLKYKFIYGKYTLFTIIPWLYFTVYQHSKANIYENTCHLLYILIIFCYFNWYNIFLIFVAYWFASIIGFFIFHSQHSFDGVYKEKQEKWDYFLNGIYGCSFLQVPWYLQFFTLGIEYHHIHHLNAMIPSYNLKNCHDSSKELFDDVKKVYISDIIHNMSYSLYDFNAKNFEDVYEN